MVVTVPAINVSPGSCVLDKRIGVTPELSVATGSTHVTVVDVAGKTVNLVRLLGHNTSGGVVSANGKMNKVEENQCKI